MSSFVCNYRGQRHLWGDIKCPCGRTSLAQSLNIDYISEVTAGAHVVGHRWHQGSTLITGNFGHWRFGHCYCPIMSMTSSVHISALCYWDVSSYWGFNYGRFRCPCIGKRGATKWDFHCSLLCIFIVCSRVQKYTFKGRYFGSESSVHLGRNETIRCHFGRKSTDQQIDTDWKHLPKASTYL
jgi:hypothetical protein